MRDKGPTVSRRRLVASARIVAGRFRVSFCSWFLRECSCCLNLLSEGLIKRFLWLFGGLEKRVDAKDRECVYKRGY
jgi:hypothetical protein